MADQTISQITIDAEPSSVMGVIADFAAYPEWTGAVKEAEVLQRHDDGRAEQVRFVLDAGPVKDEYVLRYDWDSDRQVRWSLVRARILRQLDGSYTLAPDSAGGTQVTYQLTVDARIPLLGVIKRRAEKVIIDTALTELKRRVEAR